MAKQTKKSKPTKARSQAPEVITDIDPPELASPSQGDFERVRDLLRQRSAALILEYSRILAPGEGQAHKDPMESLLRSTVRFDKSHVCVHG
jgi:hypothetical protein